MSFSNFVGVAPNQANIGTNKAEILIADMDNGLNTITYNSNGSIATISVQTGELFRLGWQENNQTSFNFEGDETVELHNGQQQTVSYKFDGKSTLLQSDLTLVQLQELADTRCIVFAINPTALETISSAALTSSNSPIAAADVYYIVDNISFKPKHMDSFGSVFKQELEYMKNDMSKLYSGVAQSLSITIA